MEVSGVVSCQDAEILSHNDSRLYSYDLCYHSECDVITKEGNVTYTSLSTDDCRSSSGVEYIKPWVDHAVGNVLYYTCIFLYN